MIKKIHFLLIAIGLLIMNCCNNEQTKEANKKLQVVTTTTMITDVVKHIGGDAIELQGLMGSGVDPHLYKASEGDVNKVYKADMVFYNGLHLEGKLEDIFKKMENKGVVVIAVSEAVQEKQLIGSGDFKSNYDPHIWFDVDLWRTSCIYIAEQLIRSDSANKGIYESNLSAYLRQLDSVKHIIDTLISEIAVEDRILITAHDAFNYFGRAYNFEVMGLQGMSTSTEAGVKDVQNLANFIVNREVKAIFVESSVPRRNIEALQKSVKSKGFDVSIGGELFSDACGNAGTYEGTYLGMYLHNVKNIVSALKKE